MAVDQALEELMSTLGQYFPRETSSIRFKASAVPIIYFAYLRDNNKKFKEPLRVNRFRIILNRLFVGASKVA